MMHPSIKEVEHDGFTIYVSDRTDKTILGWYGIISVFSSDRSVAELSTSIVPIKGLEGNIYYFNRIRVFPELEGTGQGKALMIEVCKLADKHNIIIYNELNPYGKRDMKSLKRFFKASGFEKFKDEYGSPNVMIRKPQTEVKS